MTTMTKPKDDCKVDCKRAGEYYDSASRLFAGPRLSKLLPDQDKNANEDFHEYWRDQVDSVLSEWLLDHISDKEARVIISELDYKFRNSLGGKSDSRMALSAMFDATWALLSRLSPDTEKSTPNRRIGLWHPDI